MCVRARARVRLCLSCGHGRALGFTVTLILEPSNVASDCAAATALITTVASCDRAAGTRTRCNGPRARTHGNARRRLRAVTLRAPGQAGHGGAGRARAACSAVEEDALSGWPDALATTWEQTHAAPAHQGQARCRQQCPAQARAHVSCRAHAQHRKRDAPAMADSPGQPTAWRTAHAAYRQQHDLLGSVAAIHNGCVTAVQRLRNGCVTAA